MWSVELRFSPLFKLGFISSLSSTHHSYSLAPVLRWVSLPRPRPGPRSWEAPPTTTQVSVPETRSECPTFPPQQTHMSSHRTTPQPAPTPTTHPAAVSSALNTTPIHIFHPGALRPAPLNRWPLSPLISWQSTLITRPPRLTYTHVRAQTHVHPLFLHCISLSLKRRRWGKGLCSLILDGYLHLNCDNNNDDGDRSSKSIYILHFGTYISLECTLQHLGCKLQNYL